MFQRERELAVETVQQDILEFEKLTMSCSDGQINTVHQLYYQLKKRYTTCFDQHVLIMFFSEAKSIHFSMNLSQCIQHNVQDNILKETAGNIACFLLHYGMKPEDFQYQFWTCTELHMVPNSKLFDLNVHRFCFVHAICTWRQENETAFVVRTR